MSHTLTDTTAMPGMVFTIDSDVNDAGFTAGTVVRVVGNTIESAADHYGHAVRHAPTGYPRGTNEVAWSIVDDGDGVLVTTRPDWMHPGRWEEGVTAYVHAQEMTPVLRACDRHRDFGFHLHYNGGSTHSNLFYDSRDNGADRRRDVAFFAPAHMVNTVFGVDPMPDLARRGVSQPVTPAEHGSRPPWPIYPCAFHSYQTLPHYHVTNTGQEDGTGGTGHNSTVYESDTRHTVQGKRFQPGAPEPVSQDVTQVEGCFCGMADRGAPGHDHDDTDLVRAQDHTLRRAILLKVIASMDSVDERYQSPTEDQYERAIRDAVNW